MRKVTIVLLGAVLLTTAACNTMRGAARDTEAAADAVDKAATGD